MQPFPHLYQAQATAADTGPVRVSAAGLPALDTFPPPEFDGPAGHWSPETLLLASIADCYILSLRATARASRLGWTRLSVDVDGVLDRVDGVMRFTRFTVRPRLALADGASESLAQTVLDKAKRTCLVTNSLSAECVLEAVVLTAQQG